MSKEASPKWVHVFFLPCVQKGWDLLLEHMRMLFDEDEDDDLAFEELEEKWQNAAVGIMVQVLCEKNFQEITESPEFQGVLKEVLPFKEETKEAEQLVRAVTWFKAVDASFKAWLPTAKVQEAAALAAAYSPPVASRKRPRRKKPPSVKRTVAQQRFHFKDGDLPSPRAFTQEEKKDL